MSVLALQTMQPNEFGPIEQKSYISSLIGCCNF
jgi:hypothetical protein